jgi:serine/threonine-protein kinase
MLDGDPKLDAVEEVSIPGYVVGEQLGTGGFGRVFRARHAMIGREVAIKVLHRRYASDPDVLARFVAEARVVNQIPHPGIVEIFDFGTLADGRQFFIMELLTGKSVRQLLLERGRLELAEALPILRGIADAVEAAHAAGIAHRDLKPDNVFVCSDGRIKLIDFGLAKLTHDATRLTQSGLVFGTPRYMSPEQCRGQVVDTRTDLYAFGALAYHVLVGNPPFAGDALELALHQLNDVALAPSQRCPGVPPHVDDVILALLAKDPNNRPALSVAVETLEHGLLGTERSVKRSGDTSSMLATPSRPGVAVGAVASSPSIGVGRGKLAVVAMLAPVVAICVIGAIAWRSDMTRREDLGAAAAKPAEPRPPLVPDDRPRGGSPIATDVIEVACHCFVQDRGTGANLLSVQCRR